MGRPRRSCIRAGAGKIVNEMIGLWRIEQRKPEQHREEHSDRSEQMGELASHVANIYASLKFSMSEIA
jgi:hypothetical protein